MDSLHFDEEAIARSTGSTAVWRSVWSSLLAAVVLTSCGGGGSSGSGGQSSVPSISNLQFSPTSAPFVQGAAITVSGSIDFSDSGGDIATLGIETFDPSGLSLSKTSTPVSGAAGTTSGSIAGVVSVSTATPGNYSFHIWVTDAKGNTSNILTGTLQVSQSATAGLVTATGPWASTLIYGNGKLYWSETSETPVRSIPLPAGPSTEVVARVEQPASIVSVSADTVWLDLETGVAPSGCAGPFAVRVLKRTDPAGVTTVLATGDGCYPGPVDLFSDGTNIYWVTLTDTGFSILSTPLAGGKSTVLATGSPPMVAAMQAAAGAIFWMEGLFPTSNGAIRSVPTGGGPVTTYVSGLNSRAGTFAVGNSSIYYTTANFPSSENLWAVPLAGGAPVALATLATTPRKCVVTPTRFIWIDLNSVESLALAGGATLQLAASAGTPTDILINSQSVVWSETNGGTTVPLGGFIKSVPTAGGAVSTILQSAEAPSRLGLDSSNQIIWIQGGGGAGPVGSGSDAQIARISAAGAVQVLVSGFATDSPLFALGSSDLFVVDGPYIKRVALTGGLPQVVATPPNAAPLSLVTDDTFIYWVGGANLSVYRVPVGGGAVDTLFTGAGAGGSFMPRARIRLANGNLYWIAGSSLMGMPAAGGPATTLFQGPQSIFDIAADANNAYAAAQQSSTSSLIYRIPLSGGAPAVLTGASAGYVSMELSAANLYWIDLFTLGKVPKGGGAPSQVASIVGGIVDSRSAASIALDATNVYWTEQPALDIRMAPQ